MKRIALSLLTIALAASFSGMAFAQAYGPGYDQGGRETENLRRDYARVTRVEHVFYQNDRDQRDPYQRQECWNEDTRRNEGGYYRDESGRLYRGDDNNKTTRTVIGAIVGGALGNQVGGGDGRTAATIAGAVIGASVGKHSAENGRDDGYDRYSDNSGIERRCRTIGDGRRGRGRDAYRVSYTYAGQSYQAITNVNPGRSLRVVVDVRPEAEEIALSR